MELSYQWIQALGNIPNWYVSIHFLVLFSMFITGVQTNSVQCDSSCGTYEETSPYLTLHWFKTILPQLLNKKVRSLKKWKNYFQTILLQFYGKPLWQGIQGPNEVLYVPHGLVHTVLNLQDNVAVTENYLFVDALPGIILPFAQNHTHHWLYRTD